MNQRRFIFIISIPAIIALIGLAFLGDGGANEKHKDSPQFLSSVYK